MSRLRFFSAIALALSVQNAWSPASLLNKPSDDPYARAPRSKGEKARNKKFRRG